jgi:hypothetical protein
VTEHPTDADRAAAQSLRLFTRCINIACVALVVWIASICVHACRDVQRLDKLERDVEDLRQRFPEVPRG